MKYYSTQRPLMPGSFPNKADVKDIQNFDMKIFCKEIGRDAWGYVEYEQELTKEEVEEYELIPEGVLWYSVTISSKKHGGGLHAVVDRNRIRAVQCPLDMQFETRTRTFKRRYFESLEEAQRVCDSLNSSNLAVENG